MPHLAGSGKPIPQRITLLIIALLIIFLWTLTPGIGSIALAQPHEHTLLHRDANLTFEVLLEHALNQAPERELSTAAADQAAWQRAVAQRWIVGLPSVESTLYNDGLQSNQGYREMEAGVQVELWRPGERRHAQAQGQAYSARSMALDQWLQLQLAGRLRHSLAELELADLELAAAHAATEDALRLLDATRRMLAAGVVSELDILQAEAVWLEYSQQELSATALVVDAERHYQVLTGLSVRPIEPHRETLSPSEQIPDNHPLLRLRITEVQLRDKAIGEAERLSRGSPSMSLGVRRERGDFRQDYLNSVGVSVSIPLTSRAVIGASTSNARAARTESDIALIQDQRELSRQFHEVRHELHTLEQKLPLSERRLDTSQRRARMAEIAYLAGETDLTHVIQALQAANTAHYEHQRLLLSRQHLITQYNQIVGVLP